MMESEGWRCLEEKQLWIINNDVWTMKPEQFSLFILHLETFMYRLM